MNCQVSVLIVSYNVKEYAAHAVDAILKSDLKELEIIIVDNHSFDGTVEYLQNEYPAIQIITNKENKGFGKAVNQAAKVARGEYLLILNPDTVIQEKTISVLLKYLRDNPAVGMVGPKILNSDGSLQPACKRSFPTLRVAVPKLLGMDRLFPKSRWAGKYNLTFLDPDQIHEVDAISGSCMFLKRSLFNELHGFDEDFFMFGEDLDLCFRIREKGLAIHYLPVTQIIHYQGESVKSAPFDSINAFYKAMNIFINKHYSASYGFMTNMLIRVGIFFRKMATMISQLKSQILSVILDMLAVTAAFLLAIPFRFDHFEPIVMSKGLVPLVYIVFWLSVGMLFQLYTRYILSYTRAILSSVTGFFLAVAFTYFFKQYAFSRMVIILATAIITLIIPGWRLWIHYFMSKGYLRPIKEQHNLLFTRKTLIVGSDQEGIRIANHIMKRFNTGLDVMGFTDDQLRSANLPLPFFGNIDDLSEIVKKHAVRELIFSNTAFSNEEVLNIMDRTKTLKLTYRMVPRHQDILLGKASIEDIGDYSFVNIEYNLFNRMNLVIKRLFDTLIAFMLFIIFLPVFLARCFAGFPKKIEFWGQDSGKFFGWIFESKSSLIRDLPLLLSVITGKISLVGSSLVPTGEDDPRLICAPGLTGLERLRNVKFNNQDRRMLDHYYVQNQSLSLDIEILVKTVLSA